MRTRLFLPASKWPRWKAITPVRRRWSWRPEGAADDRPATVLYYCELEAILRYELHETSYPDVVATIIPNPNISNPN